MATALYIPRINNNDDEVKVLAFGVQIGDRIQSGQIIGQIETDKAVMDVTASSDGFVLGFVAQPDETAQVGTVMLWLGDEPGEAMPKNTEGSVTRSAEPSATTAKARLLIQAHGLQIDQITPIDGRITVEAIERHLAAKSGRPSPVPAAPTAKSLADTHPETEGTAVSLTREEKGMAQTVAWHRDFAVPGYIEIDYELAPWQAYAKRFQEANGLLMPPLLPLMAYRLIRIAREMPRLNATMVDGKRFEYVPVNLGFTIQAGESLYLAVVRAAHEKEELAFVNALGEVLRRASGNALRESEASGATIGFSSMERWKVMRHIPILPPHTALMVAHAAGQNDRAVLGASYDHRVLNGGQVVAALKKLSIPEDK